jgi:iron-regulated transporter 1
VSTIVFARPNQFRYPAGMSCIAVALSCLCFTAYVKQRIGHLAHPFRCWTARTRRASVYRSVPQEEMTVV